VCSSDLGYSFLDSPKILDGGLRGGELGCVAAIPGLGKTLFLGNLAINSFLNKKRVLVVSFETSDMRLTSRFLSNLLEASTKSITTNISTDTDEELRKIHERDIMSQEGDLIIKEYPAKVISTNDLMAFLLDLQRFKGFVPDLIILDYLLIMTTNDKKGIDASNTYLKYKTVSEEVRNLAKYLKIPIWTASQIGRDGQAEGGGSKAITTSKEMSESRGIYDTVDFFVTLNQTINQKKKNEIGIFIDKNRNGESGFSVSLEINYELMKIVEKV
jgi:replicative DNA helicase